MGARPLAPSMENCVMTDVSGVLPAATLYEYEFHELANRFPIIEGEEYDALIDSIERQGLLNPITLYQGKILDGRNRYRAARAAKYNFTAKDFLELRVGADPNDFVISTNAQRRHLSTDQKRDLVIQIMRERPDVSDRQIAKLTGVDNKTVGNYRRASGRTIDRVRQSVARPRQSTAAGNRHGPS